MIVYKFAPQGHRQFNNAFEVAWVQECKKQAGTWKAINRLGNFLESVVQPLLVDPRDPTLTVTQVQRQAREANPNLTNEKVNPSLYMAYHTVTPQQCGTNN